MHSNKMEAVYCLVWYSMFEDCMYILLRINCMSVLKKVKNLKV